MVSNFLLFNSFKPGISFNCLGHCLSSILIVYFACDKRTQQWRLKTKTMEFVEQNTFDKRRNIYCTFVIRANDAHKDVLSFRFHCWRTIFISLEFFNISFLFFSFFISFLLCKSLFLFLLFCFCGVIIDDCGILHR